MSSEVAKSERVGAISIALVKIGIVITVPAFLVGSQIIRSLGFKEGVGAIVIGCSIIATIASMAMFLASKTHLSTYHMASRSFGKQGARIVSAVIGLTLIGWFAVTARLFGDAAIGLTEYFGLVVPPSLLIVGGSALAVLTVIYGFRSLERFSRIATPFLLMLLVLGFCLILQDYPVDHLFEMEPQLIAGMDTVGAAVSLLIGAFMVGIVISPDYGRYAKKPRDGVLAAWITYAIGGSIVLIGAGLPGLALGSDDLIASFSAAGLGVWAFVLLIVATWTTNAGNLYSSGLATSKALDHPEKNPRLTLILGVVSVIIALIFDLTYFGKFLQLLAVTIPPIAGIYLLDGLVYNFEEEKFHERRWDGQAFVTWVFSSAIGFLITLSNAHHLLIPALVTLLLAFIFRWAAHKISMEVL